MDSSILQDNLYWGLLQVSLRAKHSLIKLAEQHDLAIMQMFTICSMDPEKPMPMNTISCILSCDASNVTGIVDRLFTQHLIAREEKPQDRRVKMIKLTDTGIALQTKLLEEIRAYEPDSLNNLSAGQKQELLKLVKLALQPPRT